MSAPIHIRLLRLLEQIAEAGEACPRNVDFADRLGCRPCAVANAFCRLVEDNRIETRRVGNRRQVTLVPSGLSTADPSTTDTVAVRPRVREIADIAAVVFDTTAKDLLSSSRFGEHVAARNAVCAIARGRGWAYSEIARVLRKDHTTIIHSVRRAQCLAEASPSYAQRLSEVDARTPPTRMLEVA